MRWSEAVNGWREVVGEEYVVVDEASLAAAGTATFSTTQQVVAVVYPADVQEVQECLQVANKSKMPVYPLSIGKNWGYGSRVPVETGCAVLSLERMQRIVDCDPERGAVTVEPGVTFQALFDYLRARDIPLLCNAPGSTAEGSIIGHALEQGILQGVAGERWRDVGELEVVLPTGEVVHTGFGRYGQNRLAALFPAGVGPSIQGLFMQGNLGVVTKMTVFLRRRPTVRQTFSFKVDKTADLEPAVDVVQRLKMEEVLRATVSFFNGYRVYAASQPYPWKAAGGETPLPEQLRERIEEMLGGWWVGGSGIYGATEAEVAAKREYISGRLSPIVQELKFDELNGPNVFFNDYLRPSHQALYWRKRGEAPAVAAPEQDRCGVLWLVPVVAFEGAAVVACLRLIEQALTHAPFEPNIGLQCLNGRSVIITTAIYYDREVAGEDEQAMGWYERLQKTLIAADYLPYRLGIQGMGQLPPVVDESAGMLRKLKQVLDPNGILAPGRYEFGDRSWRGFGND